MIRPVTCVCAMLACASGLYLYQAKHRVQLLDREIEKTVKATDAIREQIRVLHAEWTLLNDPQRLQGLADQFLSLKTVTPGQFTSFAELDGRLPAVRAPAPVPPPPVEVPIAQAPIAQPELPAPPPAAPAAPAKVAAVTPPPAPPPAAPRVVERVVAERPIVTPRPPMPVAAARVERPVIEARAVATELRPPMVEQRPRPETRPAPEPRPVAEARAMPAAPPRVVPVAATPAPAQANAAYVGSSLGMAHSSSVPPPRPMPVSASQWVAPGGGG